MQLLEGLEGLPDPVCDYLCKYRFFFSLLFFFLFIYLFFLVWFKCSADIWNKLIITISKYFFMGMNIYHRHFIKFLIAMKQCTLSRIQLAFLNGLLMNFYSCQTINDWNIEDSIGIKNWKELELVFSILFWLEKQNMNFYLDWDNNIWISELVFSILFQWSRDWFRISNLCRQALVWLKVAGN